MSGPECTDQLLRKDDMAATVTIDSMLDGGRSVAGDRNVRTGKLNVGSYATNGVAITKTDFDLPVNLLALQVHPAGGYVFEWDKTNAKIKAYQQSAATGALTEVPNATNLTAIEPRFRAEGK